MTNNVRVTRARLVAAAALSALMTAGCATTADYPTGQNLALGNNASGDPCEASANWSDPSFGDDVVKYARSYSVNCRGQQTGATLARVRLFESTADRSAFAGSLTCGAATPISMDGFSAATARRCYDPAIGSGAVVIDADANGTYVQISSAADGIGAGVQAARLLAGYDTAGGVTSDRNVVDFTQLAAAPAAPVSATGGSAVDLEETLQVATREIFLGLHADASRRLRDALVNIGPSTSPATVAELYLEAGLADSNLRYFGSAEARFDEAENLLRRSDVEGERILARKLSIYRGLHALNQRDFAQAKTILTPILQGRVTGDQPLLDPVGISLLNASRVTGDVRNALNLPDAGRLREVVLTSQAYWALSVAALPENDLALAREALDAARESVASVTGVDRAGVLWLEARLDRQLGRIEAAEGNYDAAIAAFDASLDKLTRSSLAGIGTGAEPAIAELQLQRASIVEASGAPQAEVDAAYALAVESLLNSRGQQTSFVTSPLEPYLDRLLERSEGGNTAALADYFQALQISSESGAARQISQLQNQVSAEGEIGALIRDSRDVQRRYNEVELQIREADPGDPGLADARAEFARLEQQLSEINARLQSEGRINRITDRPAELAELQGLLAPGESYLKLTVIGNSIYGLLIDSGGATPYKVDTDADTLLPIVARVRDSIDGGLDEGDELRDFNVALSSVLYGALMGKIDAQLDGRSSLVVDGGQVLRALSPAVLVTDPEAARARVLAGPSRDYSDVPFLIQKAPISIAISPSSFIASRQLGASSAPEALIGFAEPRPLSEAADLSQAVSVGPCTLQPFELANLTQGLAPIPRRELEIAAEALGINEARIVAGEEFTDRNLLQMGQRGGSLSNYKILHFATHGASEGQFGCEESPAALMTSFGQEGSDMLLSFDEIPNLNLDANLVVLSACETASEMGERNRQLAGGATPGETLDGLVRAFFSANARAVMATYWESSASEDAEIFFERFYTSGRTRDIAGSLQDAQVGLINTADWSHPLYWGAFFVVGNTTNGMLADGSGSRAEADGEAEQIAANATNTLRR